MKTKIVPVVITQYIFAILLDVCIFIFTFLLLPAQDNPEYTGLVITL